MLNREIECRFLEINKQILIQTLLDLGAIDKGESMVNEMIIYDRDSTWRNENKFIRIRKIGDNVKITYKKYNYQGVDGASEIELTVDNYSQAKLFFENIGFKVFRHQQKLRHTFILDNIAFDIDTWPQIPPYLEIEASSEQDLIKATHLIGYNWQNAIFNNAKWIIESKYNIPLGKLKFFTFDKFE
jgi:adenylate cyclase class 2